MVNPHQIKKGDMYYVLASNGKYKLGRVEWVDYTHEECGVWPVNDGSWGAVCSFTYASLNFLTEYGYSLLYTPPSMEPGFVKK